MVHGKNAVSAVAILLLYWLTSASAWGETTPNKRLLANAGPDQHVDSGARVLLAGSGRDPSGGRVVKFFWTQVGGRHVELRKANRSTANFTAPKVTTSITLTFRLTVTNNRGIKASDDTVVTVDPPKPPKPSEPPAGGAKPS